MQRSRSCNVSLRSVEVCASALLSVILACAAVRIPSTSSNALNIEVQVEQRQVDDETHPVAVLWIRNTSSERVAFTRTFGITNQPWMHFKIESLDGSPVHYLSEVDVFRRKPKYVCLEPVCRITYGTWRSAGLSRSLMEERQGSRLAKRGTRQGREML